MKHRILLKSLFLVLCVVVGMFVFAYLRAQETHAANTYVPATVAGKDSYLTDWM
jgi:hypothetical protein